MRIIDGVNYMSAKEYAEIKGLTQSRISQIRSTLPFVKFDDLGVELINYDLLELPQKEKALVQLKMSTHVPIHTYTYQQLAVYFGQLLADLLSGRQNAEALTLEKTEIVNKWQTLAEEQMQTLEQLTEESNRVSGLNDELSAHLSHTKASLDQVTAERDSLQSEVNRQNTELINQGQKIQTLLTQLNGQEQLDAIVDRVVERLNKGK